MDAIRTGETETARVDLGRFFAPGSIAIIGASADPVGISGRPLRILQQHWYSGRLFPINPKYQELRGLPAFPSIDAAPEPVDLALVTVPAKAVPGVLEQCARAGVRFAVVLSSGFGEAGERGQADQARLEAVVKRGLTRVCGPNCEGFYNLTAGVAVGFSPTIDPDRAFRPSAPGPIGVVAQSGGLGFSLFHRGIEMGLGFSTVVSTGNEVDLEALDYVDYLIDDPNTRVILGFVESFKRAHRLVDVARRAAEAEKPIIIAKIGRSEAGRRAALSHTGALVGADEVSDAALRQLGIIRVHDVEEMLDTAACLSVGRRPRGRRVVILTASGGAGAWLADACAANGLELPEVEPEIQAELRTLLPSYGSTVNPVDVTAQVVASHEALGRSYELLTESKRFDILATVLPLSALGSFNETAEIIRRTAGSTDKALVHFSYTTPLADSVATLREIGIPCFVSPGRAALALSHACWWSGFLERRDRVAVLNDGREFGGPPPEAPAGALSEHEARAWLSPAGIPSPADGLARSAGEAVAVFRRLGGPVALKVQSADVPHKSDSGGVRLGLSTEIDVREAFDAIWSAARRQRPAAKLDGVLVQRMAADGVEMLLGARVDPDYGPVVALGLGGIYVEILRDVALRLAPVSPTEAREMLDELRGAPLLHGARGQARSDVDELVEAVVRFSRFVARLPGNVASVEINPLIVHRDGLGVSMVDASVEVTEVGP